MVKFRLEQPLVQNCLRYIPNTDKKTLTMRLEQVSSHAEGAKVAYIQAEIYNRRSTAPALPADFQRWHSAGSRSS